jgi:replicative DNA helicase
MQAVELAERLIIWHTKTPAASLANADLDAHRAVLAASGAFQRSTFWLNDRVTKLETIVGESRRWHARHVKNRKDQRGLIVVDYAQLVTVPRERGSNREQEVARISKTLKGLAKFLSVPVFLLAQLNREVEKRGGKPMMSDLRESGAIEQDADVILFTHREISQEDQASRNDPGPAELIVAKHRGGPIGIAHVEWVPELMTFHAKTSQWQGDRQ